MVTRKRTAAKPKAASGQKSSGAKQSAAARKSAARLALVKTPPKTTSSFADSLVKAGQPPSVGTVIYIHGIGNKPEASILKCQWDRALFRAEMGDRTRLAYWVDRERYPSPEDGTCADGERLRPPEPEWPDIGGASIKSMRDEAALRPADQRRLDAIEERMLAATAPPKAGDKRAKILPFKPVRAIVTRLITRLFLHDVRDFLFDAEKRGRMEDTLRRRIAAGGGPFIVVAHSQGSMIAYDVLRTLKREDADVRLFLTIGSPLGMDEVQDVLKDIGGPLRVPECVARWVNVAERLDPVALDPELKGEYTRNGSGVQVEDVNVRNPDWQTNPHSSTGYLATEAVRTLVREVAGSAFTQVISRAVIVRDLVRDLENGHAEQRFPTLIQIDIPEGDTDDGSIDDRRKRLRERIEQLAQQREAPPELVRLQVMRRFVSADLTRDDVETLRTEFMQLQIQRIWKNLSKRALIAQSSGTVQARPAHLGYGARGKGVTWAVLDTGISAQHPHFRRADGKSAVIEQWDCTHPGDAVRHKPGQKSFDSLDGNGHGTHVAGIIAGGIAGSDYLAMAPDARLIGFKVLKDSGEGEDAFVIKALDKVAEINEKAGRLVIHGLNLSLGGAFDPMSYNCGHTPLCQELRRLWNQGVVVCVAAGNEGYAVLEGEDGPIQSNMDLSIGDPANLEEGITVGSVHKLNPHTYGISYFSSRGPTADGRMKPDLVAPGERILSAAHTAAANATAEKELYVEMSGTSQATPHVSGLVAGFLSVRTEFIGYPNRVKKILLDNCTDLERDPYIQGKGMPNLVKMLLNT
ncbi:MAG: S8 family serine peptidase [Burkholderiaceae bacterium]